MQNKNSKLNIVLLAVLVILIAVVAILASKHKDVPVIGDITPVVQPVVEKETVKASTNTKVNKVTLKTFNLTQNDTKKPLSVAVHDKIILSLAEGTDGGYHSEGPVYDTSVLALRNHSSSNPIPTTDGQGHIVVGGSVMSIWEFEVLKKGSTTLKVDLIRGSDESSRENIFTSKVTAK